jgi:histidyl-tRNA synthetase
MYRPGGFPEYSPKEQKIFDQFSDILRKNFEQRNYSHIHTPSVEPVDILSRGWDIFDKQVYGLYGLAQWPEDTKDYALHFDLTIPFARYTLDHLQELVFPFKRYQMQPVRRWERQKRGRYKEFRQWDIDTIWRDVQSVWVRYDAESIIVMIKSLQEVFDIMNIKKTIIAKISHIRIIQSILHSWDVSEDNTKQVFKVLDDRYKRTEEINMKMLHDNLSWEQAQFIKTIIDTKDLSLLSQYDGYEDMLQIANYLNTMNIQREFALPIVRWHAYYTGMVAEFFIAEDIELGAIAGWGRYERLTDFIDKKNSFSGVGMSASSRIMEILLDLNKNENISENNYMFLHFSDTISETLSLMQQFISEWKVCELYPVEAKFAKQLEYADKKWIRYVVILGFSELEKGDYQIKDLRSWETTIQSL